MNTASIPHVPNYGGTSNYVVLDWIKFYTYYSNGTESYTTLTAS
jgi:hypothetical protein